MRPSAASGASPSSVTTADSVSPSPQSGPRRTAPDGSSRRPAGRFPKTPSTTAVSRSRSGAEAQCRSSTNTTSGRTAPRRASARCTAQAISSGSTGPSTRPTRRPSTAPTAAASGSPATRSTRRRRATSARILRPDARGREDDLADGPEGDALPVAQTLTAQYGRSRGEGCAESGQQVALADARGAGHGHEAGLTLADRTLEARLQQSPARPRDQAVAPGR